MYTRRVTMTPISPGGRSRTVRRRRSLLVVAMSAAMAVPCSAVSTPPTPTHPQRNLVVNGSFEAHQLMKKTWTTYYAGQEMDGWKVLSGNVDLTGPYWQAARGHMSLDLNGNQAGTIAQDIATVPGHTYTLSFALAGNPNAQCGSSDKRLRVELGNSMAADLSFMITGHSLDKMGWQYHSFTVRVTNTMTRLTFSSLTPGNCGAALDNVVVVARSK